MKSKIFSSAIWIMNNWHNCTDEQRMSTYNRLIAIMQVRYGAPKMVFWLQDQMHQSWVRQINDEANGQMPTFF